MTSWIAAFEIGNIDVACSLLRCGADVNVLDNGGRHPLHNASLRGRTDLVLLLLEYNADVDLQSDIDGWAPLTIASSLGALEMSQLLVQKGANLDLRS